MSLVLAVEPLARTAEGSKSGPIGLAAILLLCIACYFLFKSMSGHLRKVREDFPKDPPRTPQGPQGRPPQAQVARAPRQSVTDGTQRPPGPVAGPPPAPHDQRG